MEIRNAALIGLGSIGSFLAPRLAAALGQDHFSVIAEGKRKNRLLSEGTVINGVRYDFNIDDPSANGPCPYDLIILAVKCYDLENAIDDIAFAVGENTVILPVMNGLESEEKLIERYGESHVIYGLIRVSVNMVNHRADYDPANGCVYFGEKKNQFPYSDRVSAVEDLFHRAGIRYQIPEDCILEKWKKFCSNVSENIPSAIIGHCYGSYLCSDFAERIREMTYRETADVANAVGINITEAYLRETQWNTAQAAFYNKPSTRIDIESKRKTEIDAFSGTVVRLGKKYNVPTPINEWMWNAVHLMEEMNDGLIVEEKKKNK